MGWDGENESHPGRATHEKEEDWNVRRAFQERETCMRAVLPRAS